MSWLDPVAAALAERDRSTVVFFRDDDAGWDLTSLEQLVGIFAARSVPIDLATIPGEIDQNLVAALSEWRRHDIAGIHQHGFGHHNRETEGRKCEFGPSRPLGRMAADIARGWNRLRDSFGDGVDPIFTPPWNRCVDALADALADNGLRALSRDRSAGRIGHPAIVEIPITIDWFGSTKGQRWTLDELGQRLAADVRGNEPVGIMLHHAVSDDHDRAALSELLDLLVGSDAVQPVFMRELLGASVVATR